MTVWCILYLFTISSRTYDLYVSAYSIKGATPSIPPDPLKYLHDMSDIAHYNDAHHRGDKWEDMSTSDSGGGGSSSWTEQISSSSSVSSSLSISSTSSSEASSAETSERRRVTETFRTCTPCPHEMMKRHNNIGIKWICAGYQRARRTFKSECMMRYRNCQDGTMFVKIHDHICKNDTYHGRHWFYVYKV